MVEREKFLLHERGYQRKETFWGNRDWEGRLLLMFWEGLGDAIVSLPAVRVVRDFYRRATLGIVTWNKSQREIYSTLPFDLEFVSLPAEVLGRALRENKTNIFRLPINLGYVARNVKDYDVVASVVSGRAFQALKKIMEVSKALMPNEKLPTILPTPHVTQLSGRERYMGDSLQEEVKRMLGIEENIPLHPVLTIPEKYRSFAGNYFDSSFPEGSKVVVLNLLAAHRNRTLSLEKFLELGEKLVANFGVYILVVNFTPKQAAILKEKFGERVNIFRDSSVLEIGALIERANLYIGGDTGLSHLSYAVKTPTIVCFGPTSPKTWLPKDKTLFPVKEIESNVGCRDYNCRTRFKCKKGTATCLGDISVEKIVSLAGLFLSKIR